MEILNVLAKVFWGVAAIAFIYQFVRSIRMVPTKSAYIVERLGKYHQTLGAGFHILLPFIDDVVYIRDLKEQTITVPPQDCFSKDEVNVIVDGVIYLSVVDPVKASYGITNYKFAAMQLAQTTTRSVIGTLDLDRTFEERNLISQKVVDVLDRAGETWGIKVHRYEIRNIAPPETVRTAMEKQVNAERERRAIMARSEGVKQSKINRSLGEKTELINKSEGEMQRRINEAEGKSAEILALARATASSIQKIAEAIVEPNGEEALKLQLAERYLSKIGNLASERTKVVLPADMMDVDDWLGSIGLDIK